MSTTSTGVEVSEHQLVHEQAGPFLQWLDAWFDSLQPLALANVLREPAAVAIVSIDLINGFCYEGNLSSPRVAGIVPAVADLLQRAHAAGVRNLLVVQECHSAHAEDFQAFGPHGICGTSEAEMIPEFRALPFSGEFKVFHKNSIHAVEGTAMEGWLAEHPEVNTFIVVGDCTDLCVFDAAMDLKLRANMLDLPRRVIVPENGVQTYDLPVEVARRIGALPHDGDFLHRLFLDQLALNKIEVVKNLA